ncbi:MAG: T9SS type A sorting domain-containing protein [Candidatus Kapabacteria bacterium]|nr:T9SS type A sorting domain-containing protein [Candidatus Kapabacteria bacterium]
MNKLVFIIIIIVLPALSMKGADSASVKCFTIDRSIDIWHRNDSLAASISDTEQSGDLIKSFPNPSNSNVEFVVKLSKIIDCDIYIEDINGKCVKIFPNLIISENHVLSWNQLSDDGKQAAAGVYFLRIKSSDVFITHKFMISK